MILVKVLALGLGPADVSIPAKKEEEPASLAGLCGPSLNCFFLAALAFIQLLADLGLPEDRSHCRHAPRHLYM